MFVRTINGDLFNTNAVALISAGATVGTFDVGLIGGGSITLNEAEYTNLLNLINNAGVVDLGTVN